MNIEQVREYCLAKPQVTEDFPFDDTTLVFKVMNKIFACISLNDVDYFALKVVKKLPKKLRRELAAEE